MTDRVFPSLPEEQFGPEYFQDPLGHFARLRDSCPVAPVILPNGARAWLVTRYHDVRAALNDPRLTKALRRLNDPGWVPDPVLGYIGMHMLNMDPPEHTRLRRLAASAFTAHRVTSMRPRIREITCALLGRIAGQDETDLMASFASPLPMAVICELLGVPETDRDAFRGWSQAILSSVVSPDAFREAGVSMLRYLTGLLAAKRESPAGDLLSGLIQARDCGDSLSEQELIAMVFLLLVAGQETTANLIASGVLALLSHPDELKRLRNDPALLPAAIDELLRYVNPLNHATERYTVEPTEIGGVTIPAGEWVLCATSSANRDPSRFPDPDRLDLRRDPGGHLAFGYGIHYCMGAPLARLEGEVAFETLLSKFPDMALAVPATALRWRPSSLVRSLEELPVRLRASP